jgi:protein arginine N-methyltransferase 1
MYDVADYGRMLADRRRMDAYAAALRAVVKPGCVVAEIGTGPGNLAVLACRLGARRVFAIEPNDVIQVARDIVEANGCADRVECMQALSTSVTLPERADVIVSDLRDVLPLFSQHIPSIVDARARLLAPGGVLVPRRDRVWASVVSAPDEYERHVNAWDGGPTGVNMAPARELAVNSWCKVRVAASQLLVAPSLWTTIDYATIEDTQAAGDIEWTAERRGRAHGLCLWFDTELAPGIGFSNAPGEPEYLYGHAFFPWPQPVDLEAGDRIAVQLRATLVHGDYVWQWNARVERQGDTLHRFTQSTFHGELFPVLARRAAQDLEAKPKPAASAPPPPLPDEAVDPALIAQTLDPAFWLAMNPELSIGAATPPAWFDALGADVEAVAALAARFREEGYFQMPPTLPASLMEQMRAAVDRLRAAGWPAVFAFVYDEFWLVSRCAPVTAFLNTVLGSGYAQIPHVWTHYVKPKPGATGWPPHYDDPDRPNRVTVWIPLTDATLDNGCMYVIARDRVPADIAQQLPEMTSLPMSAADRLLLATKALPARAGSLLGWNFDVMHWGSMCTRDVNPDEPRISLSQEFIARGTEPASDEVPLVGVDALPTLRERLRIVGQAIVAYRRHDPQPKLALAARLLHDR